MFNYAIKIELHFVHPFYFFKPLLQALTGGLNLIVFINMQVTKHANT